MDSNSQTSIMYYIVQYSSTEDFLQHVLLIVPVTTNMIAIPAGDLACFLQVLASNSAGYGPFSDTVVTPIPVNCKLIKLKNNNNMAAENRNGMYNIGHYKFFYNDDVLLQLHSKPYAYACSMHTNITRKNEIS